LLTETVRKRPKDTLDITAEIEAVYGIHLTVETFEVIASVSPVRLVLK
jgi:hypothetical protein